MTINDKFVKCVLTTIAAVIAMLGIVTGAHAQVLGGRGNLGGGVDGALSGGNRMIGGSLQNGIGGSTEFGAESRLDRIKPQADRVKTATRNKVDTTKDRASDAAANAKDKSGDAADASRQTASNAKAKAGAPKDIALNPSGDAAANANASHEGKGRLRANSSAEFGGSAAASR